MFKLGWVGIFATLLLISCGGDGDAHTENADVADAKETTITAPAEVQAKEVKLLWDEYLRLRDALIQADATMANKWAISLGTSAAALPTDSLTEKQLLRWQHLQKEINNQTNAITAAGDIEQQREVFEELSKTMYFVVTEMGLPKGVTVYQQHCPMAFNDRGAWWLSDQTSIANPYFGSKMLTCGAITESIKFN